jgi:ribonuclease P protein component
MNLNSFSKKESLKKNSEIKGVFDKGICYRATSINVYILKKPDNGINKAAFICKKTLHQKKSVLRNRIRRVIREAYRRVKHILPAGCDIIVVGTKISKNTLSQTIEKEIADVFKKFSGAHSA